MSNDSKSIYIHQDEAIYDVTHQSLYKFGYNVKKVDIFKDQGQTDILILSAFTDETTDKCLDKIAKAKENFQFSHLIFLLCPKFDATAASPPIQIKDLKDNGVDSVFFFPFEKDQLLNTIFQEAYIEIPTKDLELTAMAKVSISEVDSEENFPFDIYVYLPVNQRILMYRKKGAAIDPVTKKRFDNPKLFLLVRRSDYELYQNQVIEKLAGIADDSQLSSEAKSMALRKEVGHLMQDFLSTQQYDEEGGQQAVAALRRLAKDYVEHISNKKGMHNQLLALSAQVVSNQNHALNVSAYSVMFALMLGITDVEDLSIAALMHDVGYYKLPLSLIDKREWEMDETELEQFKMHPLLAEDVISEKHLPVSAKVHKIIQQHHERIDGSGYPHGLEGAAIDDLSKVCAFADVFDEMTSLDPGRKSKTPLEALKLIGGLDGSEPLSVYDPSFHSPIVVEIIRGEIGDEELENEGPLGSVEQEEEAS